ncbi:NAD-dependent epimerase/dehydratase family protein, partial [Vibrio breoganii]
MQLTQGTQRRDFVYIDDVVSAYKVLIQNLINLRDQETIPVGSGVAPTIRELVEVIHSCSNSKSELEFGAVA